MYISDEMNCCAVHELANIYDTEPEDIVKMVCEAAKQQKWDYASGRYIVPKELKFRCAFYIFTALENYDPTQKMEIRDFADDAEEDEDGNHVKRNGSYGRKFRRFIKENDLGTVIATRRALNPNYKTHEVRVFVWTINQDGLRKWWAAQEAAGTTAPLTGADCADTGEDD